MKNWILGLTILSVALFFMACSKDKKELNQELILGQWISLDKTDTLDFVDNSSFYKSNLTMQYDHYDYKLLEDSIQIGYNGHLYILVKPTMHKYK